MCHYLGMKFNFAYKNKHICQWHRIKSPEINPHMYSQLIFDKSARICNEESIVSLAISAGKTGYSHTEQ